MNTEKFKAVIAGLKSLIDDYDICQSPIVKLKIEELIVTQAELLIDKYRGKDAEKKSEMPCNCKVYKRSEVEAAAKAFDDFVIAVRKIN